MNRQRVVERLRASRYRQTVSPSLHQAVMAAVHAGAPRHRSSLVWGAAMAAALAAVVAGTVWWQQAAKQAVERVPPSVVSFTESFPILIPAPAFDTAPLETEWLALEADLARLRPRLPWPPAPAEI